MSLNLDNLRKIAEAATPGPWEVCNVTEMDADGVTDLAHVLASELETEGSVSAVAVSVIRHDATHIATFDPPTVLRLLDLVESEAEYAELNPKLAAILRDTANALKGEPEPLVSHSWHDLAEVATELITRLEQAEQAVARVREVAEAWKSRGEHDMEYSKTIPPDIGEIINEGGAEMVHKANLIDRALDGDGRG